MARKTAKAHDEEIIEEFVAVSEIKDELAGDVYGNQDDKTKAALALIVKTLRTYSTGKIVVDGEELEIEPDVLAQNFRWLAVEIVKDLALLGIRVESFNFPEALCAICGTELSKRKVA